MHSGYRCFVLALWAVLSGSLQVHAQCRFRGLGLLNGDSVASGVSADGRIVTGTANTEAFLWDAQSGMIGLGPLSNGGTFTFGNGISADGSTVVGTGDSVDGGRSFLWRGGSFTDLGDRPPQRSSAMAASANGSVIVGHHEGGRGRVAYRWTSAGFLDLGTLNRASSEARAVSPDGNVVVGYSDTSSRGEAFRWTEQEGMVDLGTLGGGYISEANAVSSDGTMVFGMSTLIFAEAFRWTAGRGMVGLGHLPGYVNSYAFACSSDGQVVAGKAAGPEVAIRWTQNSGFVDVKQLLQTHGATGLSGWTLRSVTGVSADGMTLVGTAYDPDGHSQAWIATCEIQTVSPSSFTVFRGNLESGGLDELSQRDARYLIVRNGATAIRSESPITIIFDAVTPIPDGFYFVIHVVNRVSITGLTQRIDAFDFVAQAYVNVDTRSAGTIDSLVDVRLPEPTRFVEPGTGAVSAQMRIKPAGPVFTSIWRSFVDEVQWSVAA